MKRWARKTSNSSVISTSSSFFASAMATGHRCCYADEELFIKPLHDLHSREIVDRPQCHDHILRSGQRQPATQPFDPSSPLRASPTAVLYVLRTTVPVPDRSRRATSEAKRIPSFPGSGRRFRDRESVPGSRIPASSVRLSGRVRSTKWRIDSSFHSLLDSKRGGTSKRIRVCKMEHIRRPDRIEKPRLRGGHSRNALDLKSR